jgi:Peptidase C13 family
MRSKRRDNCAIANRWSCWRTLRRGIITVMLDPTVFDSNASNSVEPVAVLTAGSNAQHPAVLPTTQWLIEGVRAGFFLVPRTAGASPAPLQTALIAVLYFVGEVALGRIEVFGPAVFSAQAWLSGWWSFLVLLGAAWWALSGPDGAPSSQRSNRLAAFFMLSLGAALPSMVVYSLLQAGLAQRWLPLNALFGATAYWAMYGVFVMWSFGALAVLMRRFVGWSARNFVFMVLMLACTGVSIWQLQQRTWQEDYSEASRLEAAKPRLRLSQQGFKLQQALWQTTVDALAPQRPGIADVYGLVFAPYASEDVFKRESELVSSVLAQRFDARGRVITLLNHAVTAQTHVWATPQNLERAIEALARRMDLRNDVLVVYLTSHGGSDFKLAASHWPLDVEPLTPQQLRAALDKAGIRNRVIAVSACYSGGWVGPLASDSTLVMTAADETHTSYGCGRLSELTFFGRALFDEQLRKTHSFSQAFANAVPLIKQREIDAGKADGFSNPQISVGSAIKPVLDALETRLNGLPPVAPPAITPIPPAS